jgi:NAD(P)-dependent dehydrogenase (short-subunit alcohol dehydrogenase family)
MIARGYVENGVRTYISSRKADVCETVAAELSKVGECISLPANLASMEGVEGLVASIKEREPKLDILVNNAGANWGEDLETFPESAWDKVMTLNVKSIFFLTRELVPSLAAAGTPESPARVINIGSIDGLHVPGMETYSYSTSKAAVHHLTRVLANKLAPKNITVNAIAPGPFESKMMAATLDAFHDAIVASIPMNRIGVPEDMAGAAIYLASKAAAYVTGSVIPVDGGLVATR